MKKKLKEFRITRIVRDMGEIVFADRKGRLVRIPQSDYKGTYPSVFKLFFRPAVLNVSYVYGTRTVLQIRMNGKIVYSLAENERRKWEKFFADKTDLQIELDLASLYYDENDGILRYNLGNQEKNVLRYREEILLNSYRKSVPDLVARIKIENDLICALLNYRAEVKGRNFSAKEAAFYLKKCTNLPLELPEFEKWCIDEMRALNKLYQEDKKVGCDRDTGRMHLSKVIGHTSELIPVKIEDEAIRTFRQKMLA